MRCQIEALRAYFLREDAAGALFREWAPYQEQHLHYSNGSNWHRMLQQGINCWTDSARKIVSVFVSRAVTCKLNSVDPSQTETTSLPTLMPLAVSMGTAA